MLGFARNYGNYRLIDDWLWAFGGIFKSYVVFECVEVSINLICIKQSISDPYKEKYI